MFVKQKEKNTNKLKCITYGRSCKTLVREGKKTIQKFVPEYEIYKQIAK